MSDTAAAILGGAVVLAALLAVLAAVLLRRVTPLGTLVRPSPVGVTQPPPDESQRALAAVSKQSEDRLAQDLARMPGVSVADARREAQRLIAVAEGLTHHHTS